MRATVTLLPKLAFVLIVAFGAGEKLSAGGRAHEDDGWRRTAGGWERVDRLNHVRHATTSETSRMQRAGGLRLMGRLDGHPAVLVAFQLMVVSLAFLAFPRRSPAAGNLRRITCGQPPWYVPAWLF